MLIIKKMRKVNISENLRRKEFHLIALSSGAKNENNPKKLYK